MGEETTTIADGAETTLEVTTDPAPPPEFASLIPEEFKDKPWVQDVKDIPALFKMMDDTKAAIGQRAGGIPQDTAPEEDWTKFNKSFGVPEKAEDYKFAEPPEGEEVHEEFQKGMATLLYKAGVSQRQLNVLEPGFNELATKLTGDSEQANTDFDKLAQDTFGTREEEVMKNGKALIAKYIPEGMRELQESISNENLIILAGVLDGITKEYISEDQIPTGGAAVGPVTTEDKRTKGTALMNEKAYLDPFHPDHGRMVKEVNNLFGN